MLHSVLQAVSLLGLVVVHTLPFYLEFKVNGEACSFCGATPNYQYDRKAWIHHEWCQCSETNTIAKEFLKTGHFPKFTDLK